MRLLSLCSGYGGLDLAAGMLWENIELVAVSEIDPAANEVLEVRFPDVPNLGDFTEADAPAADVVTAGFPCQPVSAAGRRMGVDDERWLWDDIEAFVGRMDPPPRLLLLENVAGLLSANGGHALGSVVRGLAGLGFVGSYGLLRASDVGACHQRRRWFCVAAHTENVATHTDSARRREVAGSVRSDEAEPAGRASQHDHEPGGTGTQWNGFGPAVRRHEAAIGRPAPLPTIDGKLSPAFVEWMMMLPAGWVTDVIDSRTAALRVLGNGVVPVQAAAAFAALQ